MTDTPADTGPARTTRAMLDAALAERDEARAALADLQARYDDLHAEATARADEARLAGQEALRAAHRDHDAMLTGIRRNLAVAILSCGVGMTDLATAAVALDYTDPDEPSAYVRLVRDVPTGGLL